MRREAAAVLSCAAGLVVALGGATWADEPGSDDGIQWVDSYIEGKKLAKEKGRLMMIDFGADW